MVLPFVWVALEYISSAFAHKSKYGRRDYITTLLNFPLQPPVKGIIATTVNQRQ